MVCGVCLDGVVRLSVGCVAHVLRVLGGFLEGVGRLPRYFGEAV